MYTSVQQHSLHSALPQIGCVTLSTLLNSYVWNHYCEWKKNDFFS